MNQLRKGRFAQTWLDACMWARGYCCNAWDILSSFAGARYVTQVSATAWRNEAHSGRGNARQITRDHPRAETLLQEAPFAMVEMFDRDRLLQCLQEASRSNASVRQLQRLHYSLAILKWLTREHEWRQKVYPPTQIIRLTEAR